MGSAEKGSLKTSEVCRQARPPHRMWRHNLSPPPSSKYDTFCLISVVHLGQVMTPRGKQVCHSG